MGESQRDKKHIPLLKRPRFFDFERNKHCSRYLYGFEILATG